MYGEWYLCEAVSPTFYIAVQRKYYYSINQVNFYGDSWKTSRKTFQDIWLYNFEITRRCVTILKCEVILFRHVQRYEHQTSYPGSALLPLRNEPVLQIWVTGNIFQDISSKSSKRIMQYHEQCRSRETERKNKHSK